MAGSKGQEERQHWTIADSCGCHRLFVLCACQYIDLTNPIDLSGASPLGAFGGSASQPQGWSTCIWLEQDNDYSSYQYAWLSCAASSTDASDALYLGSRAAPSVCCSYDPYDVSNAWTRM